MAEPQSDHGAIDACLQQLHRSAVPQHVRRNPFGCQRRITLAGDTRVLDQKRLDAVRAKPTPVHVGEQCLRLSSRRFPEPCLEGATCVRGQRCASFLPPLANAPHVGTGTKMDGVPVEPDQLGEAQSCLGCEQQQCVIAASEPRRAIGRGKYRLDLGARQEMHLALVVALARYRKDPLDKGAASWLLERRITKEGADGGQPQITGPDAGTALLLEVLKKRADETRIQILEDQGGGWLAQSRLCKSEQQSERIPIGCDRVAADVALAHEPIGEVTLNERSNIAVRLHG